MNLMHLVPIKTILCCTTVLIIGGIFAPVDKIEVSPQRKAGSSFMTLHISQAEYDRLLYFSRTFSGKHQINKMIIEAFEDHEITLREYNDINDLVSRMEKLEMPGRIKEKLLEN